VKHDVQYAGFWLRLAAALIDLFLLGAFTGLVHFVVFLESPFNLSMADGQFHVISNKGWFENILVAVISIGMWIRYLGTPGKLLLGCHVLDARTRQPLSFKQAALRYVAYLVSFVPLCLGFFWIGFDRHKQGFHDKIAKTVVLVESGVETDDESDKSLEQLMKEAE